MFRREEYGVVLDFLPFGKSSEAKRESIAQIIGTEYFTLLEVIIKPEEKVSIGTKVYIGRGERKEVDHIKRRIGWDELTSAAQNELKPAIEKLVSANEKRFIEFLNRAGALNIRCHTLELLPSVGKKHLHDLLEARDKKKFSSFDDVHKRVKHIGDVGEIFVNRIIDEIKGNTKYYFFTKPPFHKEE